jgi:hypothetical protein
VTENSGGYGPPTSVRVVTDVTFADVALGSALPCLVEFGGAPSVDGIDRLTALAAAHSGLTCVRLDVTTNPHTARAYAVTLLPTYAVFQRGAVVSTTTSPDDLPTLLRAVVEPTVATPPPPLNALPS